MEVFYQVSRLVNRHKKIINDKRIGNMSYFDKKELKILFRKMMIQDSE
jgi:hypothetical protein